MADKVIKNPDEHQLQTFTESELENMFKDEQPKSIAPGTFKTGSKGEEVGKIQTALGDFYKGMGGKVDNQYGNITKDAVIAFQRQWTDEHPQDPLNDDGIVGKETYPRLMQWHASRQASAQQSPITDIASTTDTTTDTPNANTPSGESPVTDQTKQTTQDSGQAQVVTTPSNHLADWGKQPFADVMKGSGKDVPVGKLIQDHLQWCQENGVMPDLWTINSVVNKAEDMTLSAEDNEKARQKAERKARWDKVGNFLLHLGNAIGNVSGGGYASMKLEDPVQWTERQRMLKEKADQQRIANNQSVWAMMQKERAEQRAAEIAKKNAEHQAKMEQNAADRLEIERKRQAALEERIANQNKTDQQRADAYSESVKKKAAGGTGRTAGRSTGRQDSHTVSVKTVKNGTTTTVTDRTYGKSQRANHTNNTSKYDKYKRK